LGWDHPVRGGKKVLLRAEENNTSPADVHDRKPGHFWDRGKEGISEETQKLSGDTCLIAEASKGSEGGTRREQTKGLVL